MELSVQFEWRDLGQVEEEGGRLRFPRASRAPGVYRFRLLSAGEERHYIGETDLLPRRFQGYRTPGPTQHTNLRLSARICELLAAGGRCELSVVTRAKIALAGDALEADLRYRPVRLLVENAALLAAQRAGIGVDNL